MDLGKDLVAASSTPLVLAILAEGESYGYAIIKRVAELSGGHLQWTDGMLYPVLHRMENHGWIKSRWVKMENGRKRKYYSLKVDGKKALQKQREQWLTVSGVFKQLWKRIHCRARYLNVSAELLVPLQARCQRGSEAHLNAASRISASSTVRICVNCITRMM